MQVRATQARIASVSAGTGDHNAMCLKATQRARQRAHRHELSPMRLMRLYRKSAPPQGGWTQEAIEEQPSLLVALNRDILDAQRLAILKQSKVLAPKLDKLMRGQVERVIARFEDNLARLYGVRKSAGGKAERLDIGVNAHAALWGQAIEQELKLAGVEVHVAVEPAWQSVASNTFEKVSIFLGAKPDARQQQALHRRVKQEIANKVTRIAETTRDRLYATVRRAVEGGRTVFETIEDIRKRIPQIASNRVPTIVRTELGRAADTGTKVAMRESGVVSHMSVVGCEAIERRSPRFDGIPTCNIQNVPVEFEWDLEFHINHSGAFVVSGFVREDGTVPDLPLRAGGPFSR